MIWLKRLFLLLITILVLAIALVYLLWMPGVQEPDYTLVKTWGTQGDKPGQFNEPTGIVVADDQVFVSDSRNNRIQVFDLEGGFKRQFGSGKSGRLSRPMNLSVASGELYVSDFFNDRIQIYDLEGDFRRSIGSAGRDNAQFSAPGGAAIDNNGDIYVADFFNQRVQKLGADGRFIRQWGETEKAGTLGGKLNYPTDVALSDQGMLYIADGYNDRILAYSPDGKLITKWGGPLAMNIFGKFNGWFATVTGIEIGPQGNVFVADFYNDRVQKFTPDGKFLTRFGLDSNTATHTAIAVSVAADGSVFVADYANNQIQKWQPGK